MAVVAPPHFHEIQDEKESKAASERQEQADQVKHAKSLNERRQWLIYCTVLWVIATGSFVYLAQQELRSGLFAESAVAKVTHHLSEWRETGGRTKTKYRVLMLNYEFKETGGRQRTGTDEIIPDWPIGRNETVLVEYIPGVDELSRVKGPMRDSFMVLIGAGCIFLFGCVCIWIGTHQSLNAPDESDPPT